MRSRASIAIDATVRTGMSPDNTPNAAPRFSVYSNASQPSATSTRDANRSGPIAETRRSFVNWSIAATAAPTAIRAIVSLCAGTERLLALDEGLALDTVGDIGKRFEPLFADWLTATLAGAVVPFVHALQSGVDL